MHKHVDDPFYRQKMGGHINLRSVSLASAELGLYGISDIVELHPTDSQHNAIIHPQYSGYWIPYPVEYKHGKPKNNDIDLVQLTAQAMCLEEGYGIHIPHGAIYYGETRRRLEVDFTDELRSTVKKYAVAMHELFDHSVVPQAKEQPLCYNCSLKDVCMPGTVHCGIASNYLKQYLYAETS